MKSIQSKILVVVISALLVITAVVTAIAVRVAHDIIHKDADRILNNVSQKEAAYINEMLNSFTKSSRIMEHYSMGELQGVELLKDDAYLNEYISNVRQMFNEVAINTTGAMAFYLCLTPEITEERAGFYTKLNADGSLFQLSDEEFKKLDIDIPRQVSQEGNTSENAVGIWMDPHPSQFSKEPVISYIVPLCHGDTYVGILGFNMNFDYLINRINAISVYEQGYAVLFSGDGAYCYNSDKIANFEDPYTHASTSLVNDMVLELRAPYKDIQSNIRPMLTNIIIAFGIVLLLAIVYTFYVTYKIVTPLKKLTAAASTISSGVQDVNLIVDSQDEIGILSHVLSDTYDKIREYSTYINALAYWDSLTGVKNSTAYTEAIAGMNKEINLGNPNFGVLVADINNLKKTNDTYGHDIGNELIIHAAKILTDTFKTSSTYRIGGDEFVVILRGKDLEKHRALVEKMDSAFSADYVTVHDEIVPVSIARGVAVFNSNIDRVYTDVFAKADQAMYLNKEAMKVVRV